MSAQNIARAIQSFGAAGKFSPFDIQNRGAACRYISALALQTTNEGLLELAHYECAKAIAIDYTDAQMLIKLFAVDLRLRKSAEAQFIFDQIRRVDPKSPVIAYVESHIQGSRAVAADP